MFKNSQRASAPSMSCVKLHDLLTHAMQNKVLFGCATVTAGEWGMGNGKREKSPFSGGAQAFIFL